MVAEAEQAVEAAKGQERASAEAAQAAAAASFAAEAQASRLTGLVRQMQVWRLAATALFPFCWLLSELLLRLRSAGQMGS